MAKISGREQNSWNAIETRSDFIATILAMQSFNSMLNVNSLP